MHARCLLDLVALYTSAWIEIAEIQLSKCRGNVALYTSAWIEIDSFPVDISRNRRRTLHECVD